MSRGKRELIRRQQARPTVRLQCAWTPAAGSALEDEKNCNTCADSKSRGRYRFKSIGASEQQDRDSNRIPEPAIAAARRAKHPQPNPVRRVPPVDTSHQPVIACGYELKHR